MKVCVYMYIYIHVYMHMYTCTYISTWQCYWIWRGWRGWCNMRVHRLRTHHLNITNSIMRTNATNSASTHMSRCPAGYQMSPDNAIDMSRTHHLNITNSRRHLNTTNCLHLYVSLSRRIPNVIWQYYWSITNSSSKYHQLNKASKRHELCLYSHVSLPRRISNAVWQQWWCVSNSSFKYY